jgi:hypothetical protein
MRRSIQQESSQSLWIRKALQAGQVLKGSVRTEQGCRLDTIQSEHDGIDQSQEHLRNAVVPVAPGITDLLSQEVSDMQHSHEFVEEV